MSSPVLKVSDLTVEFWVDGVWYPAAIHVSFEVEAGKTLAIVGESGSGKSTVAMSIMSLLASNARVTGSIKVKDQEVLGAPTSLLQKYRGKEVAYIFQEPMTALNPVYTIGYQLAEVAELHLSLEGEAAWDRAAEALGSVGIPNATQRLHDYPHQLSGGMKQRVMIAMALMCEPDVLIADEPTTALDVTIQAQVLELIKELQHKKGTALLLITHDMGVVAEMADEVIIMYAAQGVEHGSASAIFRHPSHPYTKGLFNSRPAAQLRKGKLNSIKGSVPSFDHMPTGCRFHPRCPYAMDKCRHGDVPIFTINNTPSHWAKCWLYDESAESEARKNE